MSHGLCCHRLPGSHLPLNHPALELVKSVCHVFSLDQVVCDVFSSAQQRDCCSVQHTRDQVLQLKRALLRLINVRVVSSLVCIGSEG
jgi:hypothetical protein